MENVIAEQYSLKSIVKSGLTFINAIALYAGSRAEHHQMQQRLFMNLISTWVSGVKKITKYKKKDGFTSHFCSVCGSPVPNRLRDTDKIWVPAGLLSGDIDFRIAVHIYTESKASWETVLHDGKQYSEMPDFESLYNLIHMKE